MDILVIYTGYTGITGSTGVTGSTGYSGPLQGAHLAVFGSADIDEDATKFVGV